MKKKVEFSISFMHKWWHDHYGIRYNTEERWYTDIEYRIQQRMEMERILYKRYGHLGLGDKDPKPNPDIAMGQDPVGEMYGVRYKYENGQAPWPIPLDMDDESTMVLRPIQDVTETAIVKDYMTQMAYMEEHYNWKWKYTFHCQGTGGVLTTALNIRGQQILSDMLVKPELARHLLNTITQTIIGFLDWQCKIWNYRPPMLGIGNCSVPMISPQTYLEFIFPCDEWLAAKYTQMGIHMDNKLHLYLDAYLRHPKLKDVDAGWDSNIREVRRILPAKKHHINLRMDSEWLVRATPGEITRQVLDWLEQAGEPLSQFALIAEIDPRVPDRNIEALYEAIRVK